MNGQINEYVQPEHIADTEVSEQKTHVASTVGLTAWIAAHPKAAITLVVVMALPYLLTCIGMTLVFVAQAAGGCGG